MNSFVESTKNQVEISSLRNLKIMPRNLNKIVYFHESISGKEREYIWFGKWKKIHVSMNFPEQDERQARTGPECERIQVKKQTEILM
jgi:hypothetical protein